jgi:hypothetical protein
VDDDEDLLEEEEALAKERQEEEKKSIMKKLQSTLKIKKSKQKDGVVMAQSLWRARNATKMAQNQSK